MPLDHIKATYSGHEESVQTIHADLDRAHREGLIDAMMLASECETIPLPPSIEPTAENESLWSVAHAAGVLSAVGAIRKTIS